MSTSGAAPISEAAWHGCADPHRLVGWAGRVVSSRRFLLLACAIVRGWPGGVRSDLGRRFLACVEGAVPPAGPLPRLRLAEDLLSPRFPGVFRVGDPVRSAITDEGGRRFGEDITWASAFLGQGPSLRSLARSVPSVLINYLICRYGVLHSLAEKEAAAEVEAIRKDLSPRPRFFGLIEPSDEQLRAALLARLTKKPPPPERSVAFLHGRLRGQRSKERRAAFKATLCDLVREVFGDPFRPWHPRPEWLAAHDGAALSIAEDIGRGGDFGAMPILGDALEEAGCQDAAALEHCRGKGRPTARRLRMARRCWPASALG